MKIPGLWFITWGKREVRFTKDYKIIDGTPFVKREKP